MTRDNPTILTECVAPPITIRCFDWSAVRDGYEPGCLIGRGGDGGKCIVAETGGTHEC